MYGVHQGSGRYARGGRRRRVSDKLFHATKFQIIWTNPNKCVIVRCGLRAGCEGCEGGAVGRVRRRCYRVHTVFVFELNQAPTPLFAYLLSHRSADALVLTIKECRGVQRASGSWALSVTADGVASCDTDTTPIRSIALKRSSLGTTLQ